MALVPGSASSDDVRLPQSSARSGYNLAHVKLLASVTTAGYGHGFEGKLFRPGAKVRADELGANPVAIECAGPVGAYKHGKHRPTLWILWRYDFELRSWVEIARAQALDSSWALVLREPAIRALLPVSPEILDASARGRELGDEIVAAIDDKLYVEDLAVRALALARVYDCVAGRIVAAC
jgi:hypothetical protein